MNNMPTKLLDDAVDAFMRLPGIGRRTAMRMVLHLLRQPEEVSERFGKAIERMRKETHYCLRCHNICDEEICGICSDKRRDEKLICVVEDTRESALFSQHPLVIGEPFVRFYAAARLRVNGHTLGTLCAYDTQPRNISPDQIAQLQTLTLAVVELLAQRNAPAG